MLCASALLLHDKGQSGDGPIPQKVEEIRKEPDKRKVFFVGDGVKVNASKFTHFFFCFGTDNFQREQINFIVRSVWEYLGNNN